MPTFNDNNTVHDGTIEADELESTGSGNTLNGLAGDDTLRGSNGSDTTMNGDEGNDFLLGKAGDTFDGGAETDTLQLDLQSISTGIAVGLTNLNTTIGVTFGGSTARNIERAAIAFGAGNDNVSVGTSGLVASIFLGDGSDSVLGGSGDDELAGGAGADTLSGYTGNDKLWAFGPDHFSGFEEMALNGVDDGAGDRLRGGGGNDTLVSGTGSDTLNGGDGTDTVSFEALDDGQHAVYVNLRRAIQSSQSMGNDHLVSIENVIGSAGWDTLVGDAGANQLNGGLGDDVLRGGEGSDTLEGGGTNDADIFLYRSITETTAAAADRILDFGENDTLGLRSIDANENKAGNQDFKIVNAFHGRGGEMLVTYDANQDQTRVEMDVNGDSVADGVIILNGEVSTDSFVL